MFLYFFLCSKNQLSTWFLDLNITIQIAFVRFIHAYAEPRCAENIGLNDIARSRRGELMIITLPKFCHHTIDFTSSQFPACIWKAAMTVRIAWVLARKKFSQEALTRSQSFSRGSFAVIIMSGFTHHRDISKHLFVWNFWPWVYILFNFLWIEFRAAGYFFWRWTKSQAYVLFRWHDRFIR